VSGPLASVVLVVAVIAWLAVPSVVTSLALVAAFVFAAVVVFRDPR
jgi:hypothetical protein